MNDPTELLASFGARTNDLLRDAWQFTLSFSNIVTYGPVTWNQKGLDPIPFSRAMFRLEDELKSLSKSIMDAQDDPRVASLERLYGKVEPAFRVVFGEGKHELQLASDAISLYLAQQQVLIFVYTGRTSPVVRSRYQDIFLRQLASHTFVTHPFFTKESLDRAGTELKAYAKDFLQSLQRMYRTDVARIFRDYHALLVELHDALSSEPLRVPTTLASRLAGSLASETELHRTLSPRCARCPTSKCQSATRSSPSAMPTEAKSLSYTAGWRLLRLG